MCFTISLEKTAKSAAQRLKVNMDKIFAQDFVPSAKISGFSHPNWLIVKNDEPNQLALANWGLIPEWSHDLSIRNKTLNARIETLEEKPSFSPYIQNRCLVVVDGFHEWQWLNKSGSKKQEFKLHFPENEIFTLAGLWHIKQDITTFTIVTQPANTLMSAIHNTKKRMPLILREDQEHSWLNNEDVCLSDDSIPLIATPINQIQSSLFGF